MNSPETRRALRVGIIVIAHESNTFMQRPTTLDDFARGTLLRGEAVRAAFGDSHHEVAGFFEVLDSAGIEAVPLVMAWTTPGGMITGETIDALWGMVAEELNTAGALNGFLVAPHGAAVDAKYGDTDGWWLAELRRKVGAEIPIVSTLDPHANVTEKMIGACDASMTYRTNPHLDQKARGVEAATLLVSTLRGEVRPTQAVALPPIAINIERQLTAAEPCRSLLARVEEVRRRPGVLSASLILGFPYADVPEMGSGFIVVTDDNPALAAQYAKELAEYLWSHREEFRGVMIGVAEALEMAAAAPKPVCLLDMGDNVGGGGPADSTILLQALHARGDLKGFVSVYDVESVQRAQSTPVGGRVHLKIGGKTDPLHGAPLEVDVTVRSFHDGHYRDTAPRHGGKINYNMGEAAVVETDSGLTIMLTSRRSGSSSLQQLVSSGIDPLAYDVIVAKGVHAPVAAYEPVCPTLIRVNTPGITTADMDQLVYQNRRRPLFPFEEIGER